MEFEPPPNEARQTAHSDLLVLRADLTSPPGKPFEDACPLLVSVLTADARPQRFHIVDCLDARLEELTVRGFETLLGCKTT